MTTPSAVIVFGAGASFGSGTVLPKAPPLGAQLYPVLRRLFPAVWGAISADQSNELQRDFEAGMRRLGQENPFALPALQRAMAAFFFDFVPDETNLYRQLARKIKRTKWDGALATLNYERLLELSLIMEGVQPFVGSPPSSEVSIELCLPHGCCHIFCESTRGNAQAVSIRAANVTTSGNVKVIADRNEFVNRIRTDAFPPVMSYFDPQKLTTSGTNFIESQRARYGHLVKGAKTVVLVGVRVRPHDAHLWSALKDTDAELIYCSGKSGHAEFAEWANQERAGKSNVLLDGYFGDAFDRICQLVGL